MWYVCVVVRKRRWQTGATVLFMAYFVGMLSHWGGIQHLCGEILAYLQRCFVCSGALAAYRQCLMVSISLYANRACCLKHNSMTFEMVPLQQRKMLNSDEANANCSYRHVSVSSVNIQDRLTRSCDLLTKATFTPIWVRIDLWLKNGEMKRLQLQNVCCCACYQPVTGNIYS